MSEPGQAGVAEVLVQFRHRPRLDFAAEPIAQTEVRPAAELLDEAANVREVVGIVGVAHDDELAAGLVEAAPQGVAVTFEMVRDDPRPRRLGDLDAVVGRAVIDDHHFAFDAQIVDRANRFLHADADGFLFVQAGHHHGQFHRPRHQAGALYAGGVFSGGEQHGCSGIATCNDRTGSTGNSDSRFGEILRQASIPKPRRLTNWQGRLTSHRLTHPLWPDLNRRWNN